MPVELYEYRRFALDWWDELPGPLYLANHPPLYYAVMTPFYLLSSSWTPEAQQYLLRLAAIPFGMLTVYLAYLLAMAVFPGDRFLATTVPLVVAFQPQISYEAAMVNNDIVAITLYSALLYVLVLGLRRGFPNGLCLAVGLLLGAGLLTKGTTLTIVPIIGVAIVMGLGWNPITWIRPITLVAIPALVLTSPWYLFLYRTYGNFSGFAQIQELQQTWNWPEGNFFELLYRLDFAVTRFSETWGEFGWRRIPLSSTLLSVIGVALLIAVAGLIVYAAVTPDAEAARKDPVLRPRPWQSSALLLLFITCVVSYLAVVQFGTTFALTQARYYFGAVNAAAVLLMLGVRTLVPSHWHPYTAAAGLSAMLALHSVIFLVYVIPFYTQW
jgi:4-amino-4-deoxy-L-arabinose transferase-like glycosyltransferase